MNQICVKSPKKWRKTPECEELALGWGKISTNLFEAFTSFLTSVFHNLVRGSEKKYWHLWYCVHIPPPHFDWVKYFFKKNSQFRCWLMRKLVRRSRSRGIIREESCRHQCYLLFAFIPSIVRIPTDKANSCGAQTSPCFFLVSAHSW